MGPIVWILVAVAQIGGQIAIIIDNHKEVVKTHRITKAEAKRKKISEKCNLLIKLSIIFIASNSYYFL